MAALVCQFFIEKKKRACNRAISANSVGNEPPRCCFHQAVIPDSRTYCDQCKTYVHSSAFAVHCRKKCPAVTRQHRIRSQSCFDEGRNENHDAYPVVNLPVRIQSLDERILALLPRCQKHLALPCVLDLTPSVKHGRQHDAIAAKLDDLNVVHPETAVVEMGAGKADLSLAIVEKFSLSAQAVTVAVDMLTFRHAADARLRRAVGFARATINLRDFNMGAVDVLRGRRRIVCISKHLCGVGFDYALRCIRKEAGSVEAVAMAPCCHHRCQWDQLVGREFLSELGFGQTDFEEICKKSSWATHIDGDQNQYVFGYVCKWLINSCRVRYLKDNGFRDAVCEPYIDVGVTPENMLLFGIWSEPRTDPA